MGNQLFKNRATSTLLSSILSGATTMAVASGDGSKFPTLAAGQYFYAVIQVGDQDSDAREYVKVTARSGDTLTIARGQEGSAAAAWAAGVTIAAVVTGASLDEFVQRSGDTLTGPLNFAPAATIASAATTNLATPQTNQISVTGTTTITALGTLPDGARRYLTFAGALTLTHNATSLIIPGGANLAIAAGDMVEVVSLGAGNWKVVSLTRASGLPVMRGGDTMTGDLTISKAGPQVVLNKAASTQTLGLLGQTAGVNRWFLQVGDGTAEGGGNLGSDFSLNRYSDAGGFLGTAMSIIRSTGNASFSGNVFASGSLSTAGSLTASGNAAITGTISAGSTVSAPAFYASGVYQAAGAGNWCLQSTSEFASGAYRGIRGVDLSSNGFSISLEAYHQPAVTAFARFTVGSAVFEMNNAGAGTSGAGWSATSDRRKKSKLKIIRGALDKIKQLTGYTYDRRDLKSLSGVVPRMAGHIAQDVLKVLPETVGIPTDYDAATNTGGMLTLDQQGIVALHTEAIKELHALVLKQTKVIEKLTHRVAIAERFRA